MNRQFGRGRARTADPPDLGGVEGVRDARPAVLLVPVERGPEQIARQRLPGCVHPVHELPAVTRGQAHHPEHTRRTLGPGTWLRSGRGARRRAPRTGDRPDLLPEEEESRACARLGWDADMVLPWDVPRGRG